AGASNKSRALTQVETAPLRTHQDESKRLRRSATQMAFPTKPRSRHVAEARSAFGSVAILCQAAPVLFKAALRFGLDDAAGFGAGPAFSAADAGGEELEGFSFFRVRRMHVAKGENV